MRLVRKWPTTRQHLLEALRDPGRAQAAWQEFVDLYGPLVYHYCRRWKLQDADARDVTQQVFVALSRTFPRFTYDPSLGKFRSFLGTVVANAVRRHYRGVLRRMAADAEYSLLELPDERQLIAEWNDECQIHLLQVASAKIRHEFDTATWTLFEAVWQHRRPPREVAQQFECDIYRVYRAKHAVLKRLQEEVQRLSEDSSYLNR